MTAAAVLRPARMRGLGGPAVSWLIERARVVAFDLDGTLIDTVPDIAAALNATLGMLGGRLLPVREVRELVGGGVDRLVKAALVRSSGDARRAAELNSVAIPLFRNLYRQRILEEGAAYPGVLPALTALRAAGLTLGCITNKDSTLALPLLEAAGLSGLFSFVYCGDRTEERKPSPSMLLAACTATGSAPRQMLYVGDAHTDVIAARAAGCRVVLVDYGYGLRGSAEVTADAIVGSLEDLAALPVPTVRRRIPRANTLPGGLP